jgi:hypothetical protein
MGEALVAIGQGSFTPTATERARLREAFGDDDHLEAGSGELPAST